MFIELNEYHGAGVYKKSTFNVRHIAVVKEQAINLEDWPELTMVQVYQTPYFVSESVEEIREMIDNKGGEIAMIKLNFEARNEDGSVIREDILKVAEGDRLILTIKNEGADFCILNQKGEIDA